jgi:acyl carrier protein
VTRAEILEGVACVAREQLGWNGELNEEMRLVESLGLDSLRILTLVVALEDRFRICLDDEAEVQVETVADLVGTIGSKLAKSAADAE